MNSTQPNAWNFVHNNLVGEWLDGAPLGNGDLGAVMMANHKQITFPLSKSDLWDERCDDGTGQRRSFRIADSFAEVRDLIKRQQWGEIEQRFAERCRQWRGKFMLLPAGSLVLSTARFEKEIELLDFGQGLDMQRATATAAFSTRVRRQTTEALVSVEHQVLAVRVQHDLDWRKGNPPRPMTFGMDINLNVKPKEDPKARVESGIERGVLWTRVRGYHKVDYTIAVRVEGIRTARHDQGLTVTAKDKADFVIYVAVGSRNEAIRRARAAGRAGYARIKADHLRWWKRFWGAAQVRIPDENLLRQYHFGLYLLGSSSRKGFPMPGLQGLWSVKPEGSGWNDYTNDLNIQMNYWPIYASNHLELGWPYYDTVRGWLPELRKFTREYWGCRGVQFSCCASQKEGIIPPGYVTTIHWAGHAAFVAQNFWTHYEFSRDETFLRAEAYPFLKECALFYLDFLQKDRRGRYAIWPSNTPEAGEGSYEAWGKNPTMDIALIRLLFRAVVESCRILDCDAALAVTCRERLERMPPFPVRNGWLIEMESKEFRYSHRHPGMLTPIYPCAQVSGRLAERSINRFIEKGRWLWCGFSPVWVAAACARVGRGKQARDLLREFMEVYTLRQGGFNLNFDYAGTRGTSGPKCFTNETNSGFSAALLEMLLQSHNDLIRVFPAVPHDWKDISFKNLRAQGAFLVSATRRNGTIREIRIHSERGGRLRLASPWSRQVLVFDTRAGQTLVVRKPSSD